MFYVVVLALLKKPKLVSRAAFVAPENQSLTDQMCTKLRRYWGTTEESATGRWLV